MTLHSFLAGLAAAAIFVTACGLLMAWRRPATLEAWLTAAVTHSCRFIYGTPAGCGRHSAAAFTVRLDAIMEGRQPLAIEAPRNLPGPALGPSAALGTGPGSRTGRAGEPTDDDRYYARQAHGYIPQLDPDHITLPDDATIRLTPIQQNIALAWDQAGINERTRAWTPRAVTACSS